VDPVRGRNTLILLAGIVVGFQLLVSASVAASTDNLVPTGSYFRDCVSETSSDHGGPVCQTDNSQLTVWFQSSVTASAETTVRAALNGSYDPTDLNVSYPATVEYNGSAETDIIYQINPNDLGSLIGLTWCDDAVGGYKCDQQYVRFVASNAVDRELACHETGHAVGLTHGAQADPVASNSDGALLGCMETPDTGNHPYLQSNNVDNINDVY
jgi:hypothetical protein